ncbi:P-loop containing nucleoside triphosphate hydrolase protein [Paraphaeosphaeria sporulosa]|uniref:p-loop containing nucleoside triphosphate hydrolase protein n=1 Tax=Paraphaeosphaeria sporulosa TaxID=1460663 RepID=A0A177C6C3_9PLEO|nr:P-loop containing nucleoside triphosphate hydrolase protein [Paraphaeosphaeria sporulosa]OAG03183.1 P-loop containing nucleoside triphosphate hydrolase protein [Paraphaeosphaeria sporulosa]
MDCDQQNSENLPIAYTTLESSPDRSPSIGSLSDLDKNAEHEINLGEICELHVYETRFNSKGEEVVLQVGAKEELDTEEIRSPDAALVLMRCYDESKVLESTILEIRSPYIKKAMVDVIGKYPGVDIGTSGILKIYDEPRCLFHYRDELNAYAQANSDEDVKQHVTYLLKYVRQALRKEIASYETHMASNTETPGLDFDNLWMVFRPGDLLYHNINGEGQVCRLRSMRIQECNTQPLRYAKFWYLSCEIIKCDGEDFIYSWGNTSIFVYDGFRSLSDLEIIPLRFHKDNLRIRESLMARGRVFLTLLGVNHRNYRGTARIFKDIDDDGDAEYETLEVRDFHCIQSDADGRVVVDCEEYVSNIDPSMSDYIQGSKLIRGKDMEHEKLCDDDILICSQEIAGFSFQHRRWGLFKVSGLAEIEYNRQAFDALVLPQHYKDLLISLVNAHQNHLSDFDDLVKGKGKGLLFLLHGEPGVGKTLTAESISEITQRPLYTIGAGEMGQNSALIERELTRTLKLATRWNAYILLDEADVFMVQRSSWDSTRNALVAVLLRVMEYFEGIMFMTTNRLQSIDDAFASRVHLMLAYPQLGEEARRTIWTTFVSSTSSSTVPVWLDDEFLDEVAAYEINGRQIKNVTRLACAIAANDNRELAANDIMKALEAFSDMSYHGPVQPGQPGNPGQSLQSLLPPQPVPIAVHYKRWLDIWTRNYGREIILLLPTAHVVGALLAIGLASALRHGAKFASLAYWRFHK